MNDFTKEDLAELLSFLEFIFKGAYSVSIGDHTITMPKVEAIIAFCLEHLEDLE